MTDTTDIMFKLQTPPPLRHTTLAAASGMRAEVRPPALGFVPGTLWQRVMAWLLAPAPQRAAPQLGRLTRVRADFLDALADIRTPAADGLRQRIEDSRSLRELWHLRTEVYRVVGVALSQFHAEERLAQLNQHFPTRAPRSQFAPL